MKAVTLVSLAVALSFGPTGRAEQERKPNFIVILTDDQGYGDLGCFGSKTIQTPRIDRMAAEGMRFETFYATAPICTPTRASLMTGCYPPRVGLPTPLHTPDRIGLNPQEITLAELLKEQGYTTSCIGKWHLGHHPPFYPTRHGFGYYYGTPLGHCFINIRPQAERTSLFLRNETKIDFPPLEQMTETFTKQALAFIRQNRRRPFFLFLSHTMPHTPLAVSEAFKERSEAGLYGDVISEIDASTGRVLDCVRELGLEEDTYVIFTSDNGPKKPHGSSGPFRGGKHSGYEGGFRVPCVIWAPGRIPAGRTCTELATMMDLYPTLARLGGAKPPTDRIIDGKNIQPLMHGRPDATTPYEAFYYFVRYGQLAGVRLARWKLLVDINRGPWTHEGVALYDLQEDPGETQNLAATHPDIVEKLQNRMAAFLRKLRRHARVPGKF